MHALFKENASWFCKFTCYIEFTEVILQLPSEVLNTYLEEDVVTNYREDTDALAEKLLFSQNSLTKFHEVSNIRLKTLFLRCTHISRSYSDNSMIAD